MKRMDLHELLNYIDFDYEVVTDMNDTDKELLEENPDVKQIKLIDKQGAYLGDIGDERYLLDDELVSTLIDRLDIYWNDYEFEPMVEDLCDKLGRDIDPDGILTYADVWELVKKAYGSSAKSMTILPYLCGADKYKVTVEELSA